MLDPTVRKLKKSIEACEATIASTQRILDIPQQIPGAFVTGRSGRSRSLDKALDRENNRRADAFRRQQEAKAKLQRLQVRLNEYEAGEVHANGQRRADAPSRQRRQDASLKYAEFLRARTRVGDRLALRDNPVNTIGVKRLNAKTVTDEVGEKWTYTELLPLSSTGAAMTAEEMRAAWDDLTSTESASS